MHIKTRVAALVFALFSFISVCAQQSKVDSLKLILAQYSDTSRIQYLMQMGETCLSFSAKDALAPAGEARSLAAQAGDAKKEASALLLLGKAYANIGNIEEAIVSFEQSVILMRQAGTNTDVAHLLIEQGNAYVIADAYDEALNVVLDAYKLFEAENDKRGMARALVVSANVYRHLQNIDKAIEDYEKALVLSKEVQDERLEASCRLSLGMIHVRNGEYDIALPNYLASKTIYERTQDNYALGRVVNALGGLYLNKAQDTMFWADSTALLDTALQYYLLGLELGKEIGDLRGQMSALANIGGVMILQNNPDKGVEYYQRALEIAIRVKSFQAEMTIYEMLHEAYLRKNDIDQALHYYKQYSAIKDSIYTSDMTESIAEMQAKFDVDKAEAATIASEERNTIISWSSTVGGVLLMLIIFFIWRQSAERKRVNSTLNQQKEEIESKNEALNEANFEIELKNKDITDSIRYARRIQEAILPELEFATTFGKSGFVLYKPKDIVSGDFYWMARKGDLMLFAAVDCTGHGVPGAFVSIVCSNLLTQAVNEHGFHEPNDILNDVNARLSVTLRQRLDESKVRDGMDIALCCLNTSSGMLRFAGAFNPAWIIRNDELIELKADKFPVGNFEDEALRKFVRQEIQLQMGDRVYVFSDGYSDQFGGPQGKKYKRVQFIDFLKKIQAYPIHEHKGLLEREHLAWRGSVEQIDDIVVMGVEYPVNA